MLLILPLKTDCPPHRKPIINYTIIGLNVLIFVMINYFIPSDTSKRLLDMFMLDCNAPKLYQFVSYSFLHADWGHLLGNMLFLYIFGNSINDKLGNVEYLLFYLASAVVSGAGYAMMSSAHLLGASGAIASVTAAFLILFPRSNIVALIWIFFFITTMEFSSLFLIAIKMILWDNIVAPAFSRIPTHIAYKAHLIGYSFGALVSLFLLAVRALDRDQFDILALWARAIKRRRFAYSMSNVQYGKPIEAKITDSELSDITKELQIEAKLKSEIAQALARYDWNSAINKYFELLKLNPDAVLHRKMQLEIANHLMADKQYEQAANAYEKYLKHYPSAEQIEQVQLLLGLIYARYISNNERAKERAKRLLTDALEKLTDPNQKTLCMETLKQLDENN